MHTIHKCVYCKIIVSTRFLPFSMPIWRTYGSTTRPKTAAGHRMRFCRPQATSPMWSWPHTEAGAEESRHESCTPKLKLLPCCMLLLRLVVAVVVGVACCWWCSCWFTLYILFFPSQLVFFKLSFLASPQQKQPREVCSTLEEYWSCWSRWSDSRVGQLWMQYHAVAAQSENIKVPHYDFGPWVELVLADRFKSLLADFPASKYSKYSPDNESNTEIASCHWPPFSHALMAER